MIGILDSGIGGVTVLNHIRKVLKNQHYIYYSDSKNNPYGEKTETEIYSIVKQIVETLIQKGCHTIVIACNTASAVCAEKLRKEFTNISIIAIEPAIKVVKDGNFKGQTLILATPLTLKSKKFLNTYQKYHPENTNMVPCPNLANEIEKNNIEEIEKYIQKIKKKYPRAKNIVLGCTHYPLIKEIISKYYPDVTFFDGGIGVSKKLRQECEEKQLTNKFQKEIIEFIDSNNSLEKQKRFFACLDV